MKARKKHGAIRNELVAGLIAVMVLSGAISAAGIFTWSRHDFDALVQKGDIETATAIAARLEKVHEAISSWKGIESIIGARGENLGIVFARDHEEERGDGFPLVVTDAGGTTVYSGLRGKSGRDGKAGEPHEITDKSLGVKVESDGSTVGYVYYKSMLKRDYSEREASFIASLFLSIGISVSVGIVFSILLGSFLASRFSSSITHLDGAVRALSLGETGARVTINRTDEIGRLADSFNAMADRLASAETARRNLLADIAHELRTPVSVIQANLEMMIEGVYRADGERLKSLHEETRLLADLIGDLRDISDLESGFTGARAEESASAHTATPVCRLLEDARIKFEPMFAAKCVSLEVACPESGDTTLVRETGIERVIRNILANALRYAPEGSTVRIACECVHERACAGSACTDDEIALHRKTVMVTVSDEGPGVPDGDLEKIFERFYRVDPSRNRETGGRGLGLAICKQIIEANGGSIEAKNRNPNGLEIRFELPVVPL